MKPRFFFLSVKAALCDSGVFVDNHRFNLNQSGWNVLSQNPKCWLEEQCGSPVGWTPQARSPPPSPFCISSSNSNGRIQNPCCRIHVTGALFLKWLHGWERSAPLHLPPPVRWRSPSARCRPLLTLTFHSGYYVSGKAPGEQKWNHRSDSSSCPENVLMSSVPRFLKHVTEHEIMVERERERERE